MNIGSQHLYERLGSEHVAWCLVEPEEQLKIRIAKAFEDGDTDLARCYQEIQQLQHQYLELSQITA